MGPFRVARAACSSSCVPPEPWRCRIGRAVALPPSFVAKALARQLAADKAKAEKASADAKPQAAPAPNGAPAGLPALAPTPAPILQKINLRGADYSNFSIASAEPGLCQNACRADTNCAAWTYVQPGAQGEQARCWLKNRVPPRSQGNCCVSGVERGEESAAKKD